MRDEEGQMVSRPDPSSSHPSSLIPHPLPLDDIARHLPDPVQAHQAVELLREPLARSPDPEMALANLARWTARLASPASTFATLRDDPRLLADLVVVFASSQYLADILIREPTAYTLLLEPDEAWQREDLRARMEAVVAPFSRP